MRPLPALPVFGGSSGSQGQWGGGAGPCPVYARCGPGEGCEAGRCILDGDFCAGRNDGPAGEPCNFGLCGETGFCFDDTACRTGRICLAALNTKNLDYVADAIAAVIKK